MMKRCPKCKKTKPHIEFHVDAQRPDGRACYCKKCNLARRRTPKGRKQNRDSHRKNMFGITGDEYDAMVIAQGNKCALCGQSETKIHHTNGKIQELCVDHDHVTGKIRALLCGHCNLMIGLAREDPVVLSKAITYLVIHKSH